MFVLNREPILIYNLDTAQEFVKCWSRYYTYKIKYNATATEYISYIGELNLGNNLSVDNVKKLLRWKNPRFLSETNAEINNPRAQAVLANLHELNRFRNNEITAAEFKSIVRGIFPNGHVMKIFLFHIAKPNLYPIADINVFRTFDLHTDNHMPNKSWDKYDMYCKYFFQIAERFGIRTNNLNEHVSDLKKVDDALFEFGKFLGKYY